MFMFIKKSEFEALTRRVEALEAAMGIGLSEEQRRRQEALEKQFDALWTYDGRKREEDG